MSTLRLLCVAGLLGCGGCDFGDYGPADGSAQAATDASLVGDGSTPPDLSVPDFSNHDMSGADLAVDLALQD